MKESGARALWICIHLFCTIFILIIEKKSVLEKLFCEAFSRPGDGIHVDFHSLWKPEERESASGPSPR